MAVYKVRVPRQEEYIKQEQERYPNSKILETRVIEVDIDMLISIIYKCEENGIMLRRTLEALASSKFCKPKYNADLVIGKIVAIKSCWAVSGTILQLREGIITDALKRSFGAALIKAFRIADKFWLTNENRCDARFRYWVHFRMAEDDYHFRSFVQHETWYSKKQIEYVKKYFHISNAVDMLAMWDDYISNISTSKLTDLSNYKKNEVNYTETRGKLEKAINYFYFIRRCMITTYSEVMEIEGKQKRISRTFPTEFIAPLLKESEPFLKKLFELAEEMRVLSDAAETLDSGTFNFNVYDGTWRNMKQLYELLDTLTYTLADGNVNFLKIMKADKHTINTYRRFSEDRTRGERKWADRTNRAFGYQLYGHRYSRMPITGDIRKRIFI